MTLNENSVPDGRRPYRNLFNTERFAALRQREPVYESFVVDGIGLGDMAVIDGVNGWMAPFGGIDWRREFWRPELIHAAICDHDWGGVTEIRMKPPVYSSNSAAAFTALICAGWHVAAAELNYFIAARDLVEYRDALPRQSIHSMVRATEAGCRDATPRTDKAWRDCYDLLEANRAAKGRRLSFDFDYLLAIRDTFGELVRMHGLLDAGGRLVAAALLYRVEDGIDVVQWHGDLPDHGLGFSPMPALVAAYVTEANETGAVIIDLGISSVDGVPDGGLCRFKRSVGAMATPRVVLRRDA